MKLRVFILAASLSVLSCGGEVPQAADWKIPVPEGTPIIEYAAVPDEERAGRIELIEDLVIGGGDDRQAAFRLIWDLGVDDDGRLWVVDAGNSRVQVFDSGGAYVRTIGHAGQGPGEFDRGPDGIEIIGDTVFLATNFWIQIWDVNGEYRNTAPLGPWQQLFDVEGGPAGELFVWYKVAESRFSARTRVARVTENGREPGLLLDIPDPPLPTVSIDGVERPTTAVGYWLPRYAVGRSGDVYLTPSDEYQILKLSPSGESRWALRLDAQRTAISEMEIDAALEELRERRPDASRREIHSRGQHPALADIAVDGRDRLWVFPWARNVLERDRRPVDIFSSDGDLLFTGTMPVHRRVSIVGEYLEAAAWQDAAGDLIYRVEADPETEEHRVVRYRVVGPFE